MKLLSLAASATLWDTLSLLLPNSQGALESLANYLANPDRINHFDER